MAGTNRCGKPGWRGQETYRAFRMSAGALDNYRKSVWAASDDYLAGMTDEGAYG